MFNRYVVAAFRWLLEYPHRMIQRVVRRAIAWLLRQLFGIRLQYQRSQLGFVLPTTILMLLVVSLAVGAITLRTYERTQQTIGSRQQQMVYNIATPALDRARAKFEYLFRGDPRFPAGIPSERVMHDLLLDGSNLLPGVADAYVLEDETSLDINADGTHDAAWSYRTDTDGDGIEDATVAYSIILQTPQSGDPYPMTDASDSAIAGRAEALQVRNAPLSGSRQLVSACRINDPSVPLEEGWFKDESSSAVLRKNLQVDVYIAPDVQNQTIATLEFQQDRQLDQANKWGVWFRNDIDLSPGPQFNWNGAMHTEGSFLAARTGSRNRRFTGYLVSSPDSCLYSPDASEVTVASVDADVDQGIPEFRGQVIGSKGYSTTFGNDESIFHLYGTPAITEDDSNVLLNRDRDSVVDDAGHGPVDYTLDPLKLAMEGVSEARDKTINYEAVYDQETWESNPIFQKARIYAQSEDAPYLDDFFRADNRYGPKPRYDNVAIPGVIGAPITGNVLSDEGLSDVTLTRDDASTDDATNVGLDGYWERRARHNGLRLIVGQRLDLGDTMGWGGLNLNGTRRSANEEPMKPWPGCAGAGSRNAGRCNEARHRLTLRDNLAAVQATAIYHANAGTIDNDTPVACLATTVHPGSPQTLIDSTTFRDLTPGLESFWAGTWFDKGSGTLKPFISNFFTGQGTNGWEYDVHPLSAINGNSDVTIQVLQNLAYFAGDPNGGAPSFPPVQDNVVHPYPDMAMWGDFSILRRIFDEVWAGGYDSLSIADKSTLRSAACTVGMLAYNIGFLDNLTYSNDPGRLTVLDNAIDAINSPSLSSNASPEEVISRLPEAQKPLAELIMLKEQMDRDRLYGFQDGLQSNDCNSWAGLGRAALCTDYPKYPLLYSIFPFSATGTHDEVANRSREGGLPSYIRTANPNSAIQYRVIDLRQNGVLDAIALEPRPLNQWVLPTGSSSSSTTNPNHNREITIACVDAVCGGSSVGTRVVEVPFKDTALMDGREKMGVRTLNINMELLRTHTDNLNQDFWLPNSGVIYAFREDAVREDAIVRPAVNSWSRCDENADYERGTACRMDIDRDAYNSEDPPLNPTNLISPKAVDYYGDPDRRPYGFRLMRGDRIDRGLNPLGMALISDNPVYIQGDFNLHQTNGCNGNPGCRLEEFKTLLDDTTFDNFYDRKNLDTRFARPNSDQWRPAEILADAITVLSDNFCDGSMVDGWLTAGEGPSTAITADDEGINTSDDSAYQCQGNGNRTSFMNFMRPEIEIAPGDWHRENPFDSTSPIVLSRYGNPFYKVAGVLTEYGNGGDDYFWPTDFAVTNRLAAAISEQDTRVNAVLISGIVAMRANQSYGGLHNFPRFISQWASPNFRTQRALNIAGAFFQLNYSNYATGPFDQDAFETRSDATGTTFIPYYLPPKRLWGYDIGLQYAQAGSISQRFVAASALRSEFYSEPAADDPYMVNLCQAMVTVASNDSTIDCASVVSH